MAGRVLGILSLLLLIPLIIGDVIDQEFLNYMQKYNKIYSKEEVDVRSRIFQENLRKISTWNEQSRSSGKFGINAFTDLTESEFAQQRLMPKQSSMPCDVGEEAMPKMNLQDVPASFNWVEKGAVTSVKDQGSVGTCWAFSTAGNIEGQWFLAKRELQSLSVEQMNDCDPLDCGVFGGWPCRAYQYVMEVGGLMTDAQYPYCVGTGACYPCPAPGWNDTFCGPPVSYCNQTQWPCRAHKGSQFAASISGWNLFSQNESLLMASLMENGPLSVLMNAAGIPPLQMHEWGVYDPEWCDPSGLDHAVLLVGWGVEQSILGDTPYWIIKNSWGATWGESGYFKMRRGSGTCGINTAVTSSFV